MKVAIMQPTWLPWIGYFDLIDQVDAFVFLDSVQFQRRSWQCRNRVKTAHGPQWISMPVLNTSRDATKIADVVVQPQRFPKKWVRLLRESYGKANGFDREFQPIESFLNNVTEGNNLADLNINFIKHVIDRLNITTTLYRSSDFSGSSEKVTRLINICQSVGASHYVSPPGAMNYLQYSLGQFRAADIKLNFQNFEHPSYAQLHGEFAAFHSVVDLLLNCGEESGNIMRSGNRDAISAELMFQNAAGYINEKSYNFKTA